MMISSWQIMWHNQSILRHWVWYTNINLITDKYIIRLCDHISWHLTSIMTLWTIIGTMDMLYKNILDHRLIHTTAMGSHNMAFDQHYYSIWWRHQNIFAILAHCEGSPLVSPVHSPPKGAGRGASMFSLMCARTSGWANNRDAGALGRHRTRYDIIAMMDHYWNIGYTIHQHQGIACNTTHNYEITY